MVAPVLGAVITIRHPPAATAVTATAVAGTEAETDSVGAEAGADCTGGFGFVPDAAVPDASVPDAGDRKSVV